MTTKGESGSVDRLLAGAGLRSTEARREIVRVMHRSKKPLTVKAIRQLLRSGRIDSDAVTIYRSIERLQSVGIIRRVDLGGDSAYYELEPTKEHHHISCVSCGKHEDVSGCLLPRDLSRVLRLARGFSSVTGHSLEFRGVCRTCAQANARITR